MNAANAGKEFDVIDRLAQLYSRVAEEGVGVNLARLPDPDVLDPQGQQRLERVVDGAGQHAEALTALRDKVPRAVQKELGRARDIAAKQHKRASTRRRKPTSPGGKKPPGSDPCRSEGVRAGVRVGND